MTKVDEIDNIRKEVFAGFQGNFVERVLNLLDSAEKLIPIDDRAQLNLALELLNIAFVNQDYLLATDVLKFEIKPLILKNLN